MPKAALAHTAPADLQTLAEEIAVHSPGMWENDTGPEGWWAVSDNDGIKAYFADEDAAFRWRIAEINRILNG